MPAPTPNSNPPVPSRSWNLTEQRGPVADVLAAINASKLSDKWKAALCESVAQRTDKGVTMNAYCHDEKGHLMISAHIEPLF